MSLPPIPDEAIGRATARLHEIWSSEPYADGCDDCTADARGALEAAWPALYVAALRSGVGLIEEQRHAANLGGQGERRDGYIAGLADALDMLRNPQRWAHLLPDADPQAPQEAHQAGAGATNAPSPAPVEGRGAERAGEGQEARPVRVRIAEASKENVRAYEAAIRRAFAAARETSPPHAATDVMRRLLGEAR